MSTPELRSGPVPEEQKERLARWLAEWQIEQSLAAGKGDEESDSPVDGDDRSPPDSKGLVAPTADEPGLDVGQVRLFSPEIPATADVPLHVALLDRVAPGVFLAAPFSRFSEPAFPGELQTGRAETVLRVICPWNARPIPLDTLRKSWIVSDLTEQERLDALCVYRHVKQGESLSTELANRIGPPLVHPDDPRLVYEARENLRMDRVVREGTETENSTRRDLYAAKEKDDELRLAAESPEEYGEEPEEDPTD